MDEDTQKQSDDSDEDEESPDESPLVVHPLASSNNSASAIPAARSIIGKRRTLPTKGEDGDLISILQAQKFQDGTRREEERR